MLHEEQTGTRAPTATCGLRTPLPRRGADWMPEPDPLGAADDEAAAAAAAAADAAEPKPARPGLDGWCCC